VTVGAAEALLGLGSLLGDTSGMKDGLFFGSRVSVGILSWLGTDRIWPLGSAIGMLPGTVPEDLAAGVSTALGVLVICDEGWTTLGTGLALALGELGTKAKVALIR
jgi:hypothetical protein